MVTDASPWGIGGVLFLEGTPCAYFADIIQDADLCRFHASRGDPGFNTTWEALAVLVAVRIWESLIPRDSTVELRSDNLPTVYACHSYAARADDLNAILREIALVHALQGFGFFPCTHTFRVLLMCWLTPFLACTHPRDRASLCPPL